MTPAKQLQKLEQRAVRAALLPLLWEGLAELKRGPAGVAEATFLEFLSELALAILKFRKGSREQRRFLRRVAFQPVATDAEMLSVLLRHHLQGSGPFAVPIH